MIVQFYLSNGGLRCKFFWEPGPSCEWVNRPPGTVVHEKHVLPLLWGQWLGSSCCWECRPNTARTSHFWKGVWDLDFYVKYLNFSMLEMVWATSDTSTNQVWLELSVASLPSIENDRQKDGELCSSSFIIRHSPRSSCLTGFTQSWRRTFLIEQSQNLNGMPFEVLYFGVVREIWVDTGWCWVGMLRRVLQEKQCTEEDIKSFGRWQWECAWLIEAGTEELRQIVESPGWWSLEVEAARAYSQGQPPRLLLNHQSYCVFQIGPESVALQSCAVQYANHKARVAI